MCDPIRVLVVDDNPAARSLHARWVSNTPGFVVAGAAASGAAALELCRQGVDLMLLDMRLPDISGVEVLHRLRTLQEARCQVLVVSSSRDHVTVRQALAAHVAGYLMKPFSAETMRERLLELAARCSIDDRFASPRTASVPLAQGDVDRLVAAQPARPGPRALPVADTDHREALPKGMSIPTLARVRAVLRTDSALSVEETAQAAALSRATARRYLDYLSARGELDISQLYGARGRPRLLYRIAPSAGL